MGTTTTTTSAAARRAAARADRGWSGIARRAAAEHELAAGSSAFNPDIDVTRWHESRAAGEPAEYVPVPGGPAGWGTGAPDTNPVTLARHTERRTRSRSGATAREVLRRGRHTATVGSTVGIGPDGAPWDAFDVADAHGRLTEGRLGMAADAFLRAHGALDADSRSIDIGGKIHPVTIGEALTRTCKTCHGATWGHPCTRPHGADRTTDPREVGAVTHRTEVVDRGGIITSHGVALVWQDAEARDTLIRDVPDPVAASAPLTRADHATSARWRARPWRALNLPDVQQHVTCAADRWYIGHRYVGTTAEMAAVEHERAEHERNVNAAARHAAAAARRAEVDRIAATLAAMSAGEARVIGTTTVLRQRPARGRAVWYVGTSDRAYSTASRAAAAVARSS